MIRLGRRSIVLGITAAWLLALGAWMLYAHPTERIDSFARCAEQGYPVSDTEPPTCTAGARTFVGPVTKASPTASSNPSGEALPFDILVDGDSGSAYPNRQEVIVTQQNWERYWREIHAHLPKLPPLLPVDFTKNHVIALSEGQKPTGGYNLKVTSVTSGPKGTVVNVTESVPTITCAVTDAVTNRYFIARTPALTPPVSFRITTDHRRCN